MKKKWKDIKITKIPFNKCQCEKWEEEFEEYAFIDTEYGDFRIYIDTTTFGKLAEKYLELPTQLDVNNYPIDLPKVKIKARKGKIVIERIKEE